VPLIPDLMILSSDTGRPQVYGSAKFANLPGSDLAGSALTWTNAAGFGVIDPEACLVETSRLNLRKDLG